MCDQIERGSELDAMEESDHPFLFLHPFLLFVCLQEEKEGDDGKDHKVDKVRGKESREKSFRGPPGSVVLPP